MAGDRLTGLDASFLHLEDASSHMHVAGVMLFEGPPPPYADLLEAFERRLPLVPRYRQRLAFVPLGQGRPKWVDDPHFNLRYHVRSTALASPGSERQLKDLAGRVFSQQLDRDLRGLAELEPQLMRLTEQLCSTLAQQERRGRTIGIKVRYADFSTVTRARSLVVPVNELDTVWAVACELLRRLEPPQPVRLLGVRVAGLDEEAAAGAPDDQLTLSL